MDSSIFLSYNINDYALLKGDIERLEHQGYNITNDIEDSGLCLIYVSKNSIETSKDNIEKAFFYNIPVLLIKLEEIKIKFGFLSKLRYRDRLKGIENHSIKRFLLDDETYFWSLFKLLKECGVKGSSQETGSDERKDKSNFKFLEDLINGSNEISLQTDIILDEDEYGLFKDGIRIHKDDIIIDGNNHTIDGRGKSRIFDVNGKSIVLKNIIFKNGQHNNGGAIFQDGGNLKVLRCRFLDNASKSMGGAIQFDNGCLEIIDSEFVNSKALYGGALRINCSKLSIKNSMIKDSFAQVGGGINYNESEVKIADSSFSNNRSKTNGGAIETQNGRLDIQNTEFSNNKAKYGSAIRNHAETYLKDCRFIENSSDFGTIFNKKGNVNALNCNFIGDESTNEIIYNEDLLDISNSNFKSNKAPNIILNILNSSFSYCKFLKNSSEFVFRNQGKHSNLIGCQFEANSCDVDILNEADLQVEKLNLIGNKRFLLNRKNLLLKELPEEKIENHGSIHHLIREREGFDFTYLDELIHNSDSKEIILSHDISFEYYEIDFYEGGIELDIDGLVFDGNNHAIDGKGLSRIFTASSKDITIKNTIFKNGRSHKNDYQNPLNGNGGAIRNNSNGNIRFLDCEFLDNLSEDKGGAVDNRGGDLEFINCKFMNNSSELIGGAIINRKDSRINLIDSTLNNNAGRHNGGAIENEGNLFIKGSDLFENASKYGGAISNTERLIVHDSIFRNNKANEGGAIKNHKDGQIQIINSLFEHNLAEDGGAIENRGLKVYMNNCRLNGNMSKGDGGGIYSFFCDEFIVDGCVFNDNGSEGEGGAIWNFSSNSNLELIKPSFNNNYPNDLFER